MARRKKLTRDQALEKLKQTKELSTDLLKPLGIPFEFFLQFAQRSNKQCATMVDQIIEHLERKY